MVLWVSSPPLPEVPTVAPLTLLCLTISQDLGELHLLLGIATTNLSLLISLLRGSILFLSAPRLELST